MGTKSIVAAIALAIGVGAACATMAAPAAETDLAKRIATLEQEVGVQKDIEDVRRLQFAYNYYNSSGLEKEVIDLVSPHAESIEIGGQGVYKGKEGFIRLFSQYSGGKIENRVLPFGRVLFQMAGQDVIDIAPDRKHAWGRVRVLTPIFNGVPEGVVKFNGGDYEMEYIKEDGKWMIYKFKYVHYFSAEINKDGKAIPGYSTAPSGREDAPNTWYHPWPEAGVLPFHYPNPVTGKPVADTTNPEHYWIGNWPGEFGKVSHK